MFQWTTYNWKPETVPPVNRVPIGESQYYRAVTGNKFTSAGLSSQPEFLGPPVTNRRNFLGPRLAPCSPGFDCGPTGPPVFTGDTPPPVFTGDTPPYVNPPPPVRYSHRVIRGDKRGSPYDLGKFILPKSDPRYDIPPGGPTVTGSDPVPTTGQSNDPVTTDPADSSAGGSLSSLFSGIPTTYLLIGGAAALYFLMKKK